MKYFNSIFVSLFLLFSITVFAQTELGDYIYQYSSKQAFYDKKYDSDLTLEKISQFGNFGLGTLNGINGELIISEGKFFQVNYEGIVVEQNLDQHSPFSVIKEFYADTSFQIKDKINLNELKNILDNISTHKATAIKVTGDFEYIKTRSVKKQTEPYPDIQLVVANQAEFEFENTDAVLIGFWFPEYLDGANFPGYHFHCLIKGNKGGGHLLECNIKNAKVEVDFSEGLIIDY